MANQRAMLFGLRDAQGYNPVQLERYWTYVRTVAGRPVAYNASFFEHPSAGMMDLLDVGGAVVPREVPTPAQPAEAAELPGWTPLAREGRWILYGHSNPPPRASFLASWRVVRGSEASLRAVASPGFDPSTNVILEEDPGIGRVGTGSPAVRSVEYRAEGPQAAKLSVDAPVNGVVLVRTPYARNWHATVDGRTVQILPADPLLQGIPVAAGRHEITLRYHDPWIGYGLVGSSLAVAALLLLALVMGRAGAARNRANDSRAALSGARSG